MMAVPDPATVEVPGAPVPLSRLVLGTMTFGDTVDAEGAAAMLDAALDAGLTGVDTANGYAGGQTEVILGSLMATRRDRMVLATKAGIPHPDAGNPPRCRPRAYVRPSRARCGGSRWCVWTSSTRTRLAGGRPSTRPPRRSR